MSTANPERIAQVREFAGLSKTDLAQKLGVTVAAVSQWEDGSKNPTTANLVSIAQKLGVDVKLLMKPVPSVVLTRRGSPVFRAQSAAKTAQMKRRATRFAEMAAELFMMLEQWIAFPKVELPQVAPANIEKAAADCRKMWGLGNLPIVKLGELFESKGIRLCAAEFGDDRCDAYSCIIDGRPFTFLGTEKQDRARARFDVVHELGHLLFHQHLSDEEILKNSKEIESQANLFAAAFLLPAETFSRDVVDTSILGFKRLKPKWNVSIQAMIYRARTLDLITEETFERHFRNMSARGWRKAKSEPLDEIIPPVNRSLGKNSLELLENNNVINVLEILSDLPLPNVIFKSVFEKDLEDITPPASNRVVLAKEFMRPNQPPSTRN
jgi:Zn-dependent peptidase ImmA (M78 family)/transcriptional regulator with XRE-family HTH domain